MLPALAFLPIADIPEAFEDLLEVFPAEATSVADYFEDVYIGRRRRNGMSTAMFPPTVWSVRDSTLAEMPRTNNSVEAWHRGLQVNSRFSLHGLLKYYCNIHWWCILLDSRCFVRSWGVFLHFVKNFVVGREVPRSFII